MNTAIIDRTADGQRRVEDAIVAALRNAGAEISMLELLERVGNRGQSDEGAVKAAIARLLAQRKIEMSSHRCIHLPRNGNRVFTERLGGA